MYVCFGAKVLVNFDKQVYIANNTINRSTFSLPTICIIQFEINYNILSVLMFM